MDIKSIKKKHNITDSDISKVLEYKSRLAYANSSAKKRFDRIIEHFYNLGRESNQE